MTGWREYTYFVELAPGEDLYNLLRTVSPVQAEIVPHIEWLGMLDEDARGVIADGADLTWTGFPNVYVVGGETSDFDAWMAVNHPGVEYGWGIQCYVAVSDAAVRADLDHDLRGRILSVEPRPTPAAA